MGKERSRDSKRVRDFPPAKGTSLRLLTCECSKLSRAKLSDSL